MSWTTHLISTYQPSEKKPQPEEHPHVPNVCLSLKIRPNLKKKLTRAKLRGFDDPPYSEEEIVIKATSNFQGHSAGCGTPGCKCCKVMSRKVRVTSSSNGNMFPTPSHTSCNSNNVIYMLECTKCTKGNQYVGKIARILSQRTAGHRAASQKKTNLPVYKHFLKSDHLFERDIKITVFEKTNQPLNRGRFE